ncbi:hypothetical protein K7432_007990 [Basidiobolus ranarum]|uniref:Uncharacterized protein n=1 Tax=Basidiobolus ranarum TaxID=34480 RepID=A0ABR2VZ97_9FUNG
MRLSVLLLLVLVVISFVAASPAKKTKGKNPGKKNPGGKKPDNAPKVEKCSEGRLATMADVKEKLVGECGANLKSKKILRNKSAHNCKGKLYQCNNRCGKPGDFPNVETGVCII